MWLLSTPDRGAYRPSRLLRQFIVAAAITIFCSMTLLAYAVSHTLQSSLTLTAAEEGALLVDFFLGPLVQELGTAMTLSPEYIQKLDDLLKDKFGRRTKVVKIWLRDGTLAYSTNKQLIGKKFPSREIDDAFRGKATGTFDDLHDEDEHFERLMQQPFVEIFVPLYRTGTTDIIAAGKIYNDGERLAAELSSIRIASIVIVATITVPMMLVLFFLVRAAGVTVDSHRKTLRRKIAEAINLATQNDRLRQEADDARIESVRSNEHLLESIGQDLHDGPIQLLSILALKLSEPTVESSGALAPETMHSSTSASEILTDALIELRSIATGMVLPQLDGLATEETLRLAIRQHEKMSGTSVASEIGDLPSCSTPLRVCLFRIVQEALNNAYHYANGYGQRVVATADANWITVTISDSGNVIAERERAPFREMGLGLNGLRRRVEFFHGLFEVSFRAEGARVSAKIPIAG
jgi:signal transduction histidine kinase